ncbi:hypothetical protein ACFL2E_04710 [Thermodesulfobacteriota bacterium]
MFSFIKNSSRHADFSRLPLSTYSLNFSLDQIVPGVDNVRHDVYLSPSFCEAADKIVPQIIAKNVQLDEFFKIDKPAVWAKKVADFKQHYHRLIENAIYKSKQENNPQIDFLAQVAVMKMLLADMRDQFEKTTTKIKNLIRKDKLTDKHQKEDIANRKEALSNVLQNKDIFLRKVGRQLFTLLSDVNKENLKTIREANFGTEKLLPDDILENPIFHSLNHYHDAFLIDEYDIIFGRRLEDPDNYDNLINLLEQLFLEIIGKISLPEQKEDDSTSNGSDRPTNTTDTYKYLKQIENIDCLLNYFETLDKIKKNKKQKSDNVDMDNLKALAANQKIILQDFFKAFKKARLVQRISASYEMRAIYRNYCPPLVPQQILLFMIDRKSRKIVIKRLKQLKKIYRKPFSLAPLKKQIKKLEYLRVKDKKTYLIRFLKGIVHYHRDIENYKAISEAMDRINLATDEKILNLSRANNTLYEFLLSSEKWEDEKPIINHVVIKADVRGSTDITHQMIKRGLNPASYFSLNFFNPISDILKDYGAVKVFIEGDAIILAIFEREKTPEGWYGVARACGIAMNMLFIIKRYNDNSKKNQLPILELGIGINYLESSPTFLFDGNQRIMISSAINIADRQSSCSKPLRKIVSKMKPAFNLYVYQTASEEDMLKTSDDISMRYNVNGIDLNPDGFKKLSKEINLTALKTDIPELKMKNIKLHTGKFPLTSGRFQRLVIRESKIRQVHPDTFASLKPTNKSYFEVCTHPAVYQHVRNLVK